MNADRPRFDNRTALPRGSRYVETLDFLRHRKQLLAVTWLSVALTVAPAVAGLFVISLSRAVWLAKTCPQAWAAMVGLLIAYIPLHEGIHGLFMLALSGIRPRFGFKLPYAWAGSDAWFGRTSHNIIALAPLVLAGFALQLAIAAAPAEWFWPLWIVQISNLSGSAGDIYCVTHLARMKGRLLIQDSGVRMRVFRLPEPPAG